MAVRPFPLLFTALVAVAMVGCPSTSGTGALGADDVLNAQVQVVLASASPTTVTIKGVVQVAGAAANQTVYLTDAKVLEVPNAGRGLTDASKAFTMAPVPTNSVWFLVADVGGKKAASIGVPYAPDENGQPRTPFQATISEASTLAVAGILNLFLPDESNPSEVKYPLKYLAADKFNALVDAIKASGEAVTLQSRLGALSKPFTDLYGKNAQVKAAYDALLTDMRNKYLVQAFGGGNRLPPLGDSLAGNVPVPSLAPKPASPSPIVIPTLAPSSGPSASASGTAASSPAPSPLNMATVDTLATGTVPLSTQMAAFVQGSISGVLIPTGSTLLLSDLPEAVKPVLGSVTTTVALPGPVTEFHNLIGSSDGKFVWSVLSEGGVRKIAALKPSVNGTKVEAEVVATPVTGTVVDEVFAVALSPFGSASQPKVLALTASSLFEVDGNSGAVTLWAGQAGSDSTLGDSAASAAGYKVAGGRGLCVVGSRIFFSESDENRIVEYLPGPSGGSGSVKRLAGRKGGGLTMADGPLSDARFGSDLGGLAAQGSTRFLVADGSNSLVRRVDLAAGTVAKLDDPQATGNASSWRLFLVNSVATTTGNTVYALGRSKNLLLKFTLN